MVSCSGWPYCLGSLIYFSCLRHSSFHVALSMTDGVSAGKTLADNVQVRKVDSSNVLASCDVPRLLSRDIIESHSLNVSVATKSAIVMSATFSFGVIPSLVS